MIKRYKIFTGIASLGVLITLAVSFASSSSAFHNLSLLNKTADDNYTLTLNSDNAYSTGSTKSISTDSGNYLVNFKYSSCTSQSGYHAHLNNGGTIQNSDHILSIVQFKAVFAGDLQIRTSYDGLTWGNYFDITSGSTMTLNSKPYYIEMKASGTAVNLTSATYTYSCTPNGDIPQGGFKLVKSVNDLQEGKRVIIGAQTSWDSNYCYVLNKTVFNNYYLTANSGTLTNEYLNYEACDPTIWTIGKDNDKFTFYDGSVYLATSKSGTHYNLITSSSSTEDTEYAYKWSIEKTSSVEGFTVTNSLGRYIEYYYVNSNSEFTLYTSTNDTTPINFYIETSDSPSDPVSFAISDVGIYNENSIYDGSNLIVTVTYSDGLIQNVTSGYTWRIYDSEHHEIPHGTKFGSYGEFTLSVEYGSIGDVSTTINVGKDAQLTSAQISMSKTEFVTSDTVESALTNLLADLHYNYSSEDKTDLTYDVLSANYGFFATLTIDDTSHSISGKFNTAGTYYLAVTNGFITSNSVTLTVTQAATNVWELVSDETELSSGDVIVIGESSNGYVATDITSQYLSATSATFNDSQIDELPDDALQLVLNEQDGVWTLTNSSDEELGATAVKKLAWDDGTSDWGIAISDGLATISNGTSTYGRFLYNHNQGTPRFTTYVSGTSVSMKLPQIYRGVKGTPVYATDIELSKSSTSLIVGENETLTVTYTPSNTSVRSIEWTTSNSNVATVNNGQIEAIGVGSATITATYTKQDLSTISRTCTVSVSGKPVESVTLNKSSLTLKEGDSSALVATVLPQDAADKTVTWSTSNSEVATVSNGNVTAVKSGSAVITATSGAKSATCNVTVQASSTSGTLTIEPSDLPTAYQTDTIEVSDSESTIYQFSVYNCANMSNSGKLQFKKSGGYLSNIDSMTISSIELVTYNTESFNGTLYWGDSANPTTNGVDASNGNTYSNPGSYQYFKLVDTSNYAGYLSSIIITMGAVTPTDPTGISVSPSSLNLKAGQSDSLSVTYSPAGCNQNKGVTWSSSNNNVATVSNTGVVTVSNNAQAGATATITATSTFNSNFKSSCTVTVEDQPIAKWTIMIYMCGADLESGYADSNEGLASGDLLEILSVSGQPDDVNVIIETGGAKKWSANPGISANYLERYHVANKKLVRDERLTKANMGLTSTFKNFLEWGLTSYPAQKTGVILWNHGGGMRGVCYDENYSNNSLLNSEVNSALNTTFTNLNRTDKLEWIGYDACLMQVQDIAEFDSQYFNYMVASEESESGYGWDYDTWLDDVYADRSSTTIFRSIIDGFISENGGVNSTKNDQTLSYLNLSYMSSYKTAWETFATQLQSKLKNDSVSKTEFVNWVIDNVKHYADSDYDYFALFDAKDFINKIASSIYNPGSTYTNAVLTAHSNLVSYSSCGKGAGNSYGLCCVYDNSSRYTLGSYYGSGETSFTNWRTFNLKANYGYI